MAVFTSKYTGQQVEDAIGFMVKNPNLLQPISLGESPFQSNVRDNHPGVKFKLNTVFNGFYLFTYGYCMILLPIFENFQTNIEYKIAACINNAGSYVVKVLTYYLHQEDDGLYVDIYSKEDLMPSSSTWKGYLFQLSLPTVENPL